MTRSKKNKKKKTGIRIMEKEKGEKENRGGKKLGAEKDFRVVRYVHNY